MTRYSDIPLIRHLAHLLPINRSLTGSGIESTLSYFESFFGEFTRIIFPTGAHVFDWKIPPYWTIDSAYIQHIPTGRIYADYHINNLHIVGYSVSVDEVFPLPILKEKIHTLPDKPYWTPYVTSYYKPDWGFCLPQITYDSLPDGDYHVRINSQFSEGSLHLSHACIRGSFQKELFFSSYVCHPSMANNELSGPIVLCNLIDYIKSQYPQPRYSYRFVLLPETIGSIAYLSQYGQYLRDNCIAGFNLSCVGDENCHSILHSPFANTLSDLALSSALDFSNETVNHYSFLMRGSDERQYCSPAFRLPLCNYSRSLFGEYSEYHSSADNLLLVTENGLQASFLTLKSIVDAFELGLYPASSVNCEPQLGKRGLYNRQSTSNFADISSQRLLDILTYCDGKTNIFDIAIACKVELSSVVSSLIVLIEHNLVAFYSDF